MLTALLMAVLVAQASPTPGPSASDFPLACTYWSEQEQQIADHCAIVTNDGFALAPAVLADLSYQSDLATLIIAGHQWFYHHRNGRTVEMLTYDNGPDPFVEGLARGRIGNDLVYVDEQLAVKIRAPYTFGYPFENGSAEVCVGCVSVPVDGGEHSFVQGGSWGVIDRTGREIVPVAPKPIEGDNSPRK